MIEYELKILEFIKNHPSGVTISDITKFKGYSRNTVNKYVKTLELKDKIYKKKVGAYSLYYSSKERYVPKSLVLSYYKVLLKGLYKNFPNSENVLKKIGQKSAKDIKFSFSPNIYKQLKKLKRYHIKKIPLEIFKQLYYAFDIFQPNIKISVLDLNSDGHKTIYRFKNTIFLDNKDLYIYHIFLIIGIIETIIKRELNQDMVCELENYHISEDSKDSYYDISIEL